MASCVLSRRGMKRTELEGHERQGSNPAGMQSTEQVPGHRRVIGIDLGGAASATTGFALLEGQDRPAFVEAKVLPQLNSPQQSETQLLKVIDDARVDVIAIDAPLTLPPCLTCPTYCRGPGELCELTAAREMWATGMNPVSQRPCEQVVVDQVGERPLPTMQLGVITGRAVALARCLSSRGRAPSIMERGEVLEVYPRASLKRLGASDGRLAPKTKGETYESYRDRVLEGFGDLIDGLDAHDAEFDVPHVLDALTAAYTGWLAPAGLEAPPEDFNIASGWIWFPRAGSPTGLAADI